MTGEDLRVLRVLRGVSQGEIARRARIDRGTISRIERGLQAPKPETAARVANAILATPERHRQGVGA